MEEHISVKQTIIKPRTKQLTMTNPNQQVHYNVEESPFPLKNQKEHVFYIIIKQQ